MSSASTQCAASAWYSKRVPGSHSSRHSVKRFTRVTGSPPSTGSIGALGNPEVCSITCSTVTCSLPFVANSGM